MIICTSIVLPSSQTEPPPEITACGSEFTVIVASSDIVEEQLLSLILVNVYVVVTLGSTINVSLVLYNVTVPGVEATL